MFMIDFCVRTGPPYNGGAAVSVDLVNKVSYRPDLSGGVGVLPCQTEVQHVALPVGGGKSAHREV